jgi:multidrug efflux pump subunit AcrB
VNFSDEEQKHITLLNGHRAVLVTAAQKSGENTSATQKAYLPVLKRFEKKLLPNIELVKNFDQADNVDTWLSGLGIDFPIAIGLVMFTLLPLGGRAAIVVMVAIPYRLAQVSLPLMRWASHRNFAAI